MTAQSAIPLKWYVPFANGDASRVELPVTTADPSRASQTLGFPPLTMQPPESGGVPPQGEDFNGGMNQIARVAWWVLNAGGWPYDSSFATNSNINGYPKGAYLQAADFAGYWLNLSDNNQINPDTTGTNWAPGYQYGVSTIAVTGGTLTPTPAQVAKRTLIFTGVLGSAQTVNLPTWLYDWQIINNTSGLFSLIVKTAAGSGVTIPQNGAPTRVRGDGTSIVQLGENIVAPATSTTQVAPVSQVAGPVGAARNVQASITSASATEAFTADEIVVQTALGGVRYCLVSFAQTINIGTTGLNGMATGQTVPASGFVGVYAIYNPTTNVAGLLGVNANSAIPEICAATLPAGFTASALLAVIPTTAGSLLQINVIKDRSLQMPNVSIQSTAATAGSPTIINNLAVPLNAKTCSGFQQISNTAAASMSYTLLSSIGSAGGKVIAYTLSASGSTAQSFEGLMISVGQRAYYIASSSAGTPTFAASISGYTI